MSNATYTRYVTKLLGYHADGLISKQDLQRGLRRARKSLEKWA